VLRSAGPSAAQLPVCIAGQLKLGTMQVPGENTCNMILLPGKIAGILPALPGICVRYGRHSVPGISLELPAAAPSLWSAVRNIFDEAPGRQASLHFRDARDHPSQDARDGFTVIDRVAGGAVDTAVVIDAAKLGSAAHRVRAFWTNAAPSRTLKQRYPQFDREWVNDRKEAEDVIRNGRRVNTAPADDPDIKGYYRMNVEGEPIRVFPTLVATPQSFAFRRQEGGPIPGRPGPGMVYDP
jgi:hypothetical protein